jgi:glycosyltransferase involved in cell wall biosynthesis
MLDLRPDLAEGIEDRIIYVQGLGRDPHPAADLRAFRRLATLIEEFEPHIVHTHMAKAGTLGRVAAAMKKVPVRVHTFHGTVFEGHFTLAVGSMLKVWERLIGRGTTAVIPVSPTVGAQLIEAGFSRDRIRMVPLGLDLERFRDVAPVSQSKPMIVSLVARLVPVKDIDLFIAAMRLVRERDASVTARVIGDGPERQRIEGLAPAWLDVMGNQADLPHLLEETRVVALSSRSEGSPVALIEAMAAGRPVASVPVGGVIDILKDRPGAVLATDRSPRALADAILHALTDTSVAEGAATGRSAIVDEFGIARLVEDLAALYEELLAAR